MGGLYLSDKKYKISFLLGNTFWLYENEACVGGNSEANLPGIMLMSGTQNHRHRREGHKHKSK